MLFFFAQLKAPSRRVNHIKQWANHGHADGRIDLERSCQLQVTKLQLRSTKRYLFVEIKLASDAKSPPGYFATCATCGFSAHRFRASSSRSCSLSYSSGTLLCAAFEMLSFFSIIALIFSATSSPAPIFYFSF